MALYTQILVLSLSNMIISETKASCMDIPSLENLEPWDRTGADIETIGYDEITCPGKVTGWEVAVGDGAQEAYGAIWRPVEGSTNFTLVGMNKLHDNADEGIKTYGVPINEQITCRRGDRYGIFTPNNRNAKVKVKSSGFGVYKLFIASLTPGDVVDVSQVGTDGQFFAVRPIIVSQQTYLRFGDKTCNQDIIESKTFTTSLTGRCAAYCGITESCQAFTTKNGQCHLHSSVFTDINDSALTDEAGSEYHYTMQ